jgi:hypothetical protein
MAKLLKLLTVGITLFTLAAVLPATADQRPTKPTGLWHADQGGTEVLHWSASSDDGEVHKYDVYRDLAYITTVHDTEYRGVYDGSWLVVAIDDAGNYSERSDPKEIVLDQPDDQGENQPNSQPEPEPDTPATDTPDVTDPRPTIPTGLVLSGHGATHQLNWQLDWGASTDDNAVAGYNIYLDGNYVDTVRDTTTYTPNGNTSAAIYRGTLISLVAFDHENNFSSRSPEWAVIRSRETGRFELIPDGEQDTTTAPGPTTIVGHGESDGVLRIWWRIPATTSALAGYNIYRASDDTYLGTSNGGGMNMFTSPLLSYGESYYVTAYDENDNYGVRSASYEIPLSIRGEPQTNRGYAQTIAAIAVRPSYDPDEIIRLHLSALFSEFAPIRGNGFQGESSQKRQRDLNRSLANAVLGLDQSAMTTHWSFLGVGDQNLWLMMAAPTESGAATVTSGPGQFEDTWNHATTRERLDYLGLDPHRWELSRLFYESYRTNMSNLYEMSQAELEFYTNVVAGLFVGLVTGDLLSAYGIIGAAAGGFAGAATTAALNGASTEDILEEGAIGAIKGALGAWITDKFDLANWQSYTVSATIAAIDYGLSGGEDPLVGALASMVPEVAERAEEFEQYTLEEATADAIAALTPIFGAEGAERFVLQTTQAVGALLGELLVLIALVPDIDVAVEAERIVARVVNETLGGDTDSLLFLMGDHVEDVVNGAIGAVVQSGYNPNAANAVARSLNPTVAAFLGSVTLSSAEEIEQDVAGVIIDQLTTGVPLTQWSQGARDELERRWGFALFR